MALTAAKAKKILEDGTVRGKALTEKQKKFFGAIAGGATPLKKLNGGWLDKYQNGGDVSFDSVQRAVRNVESLDGRLMWNPESTATGLYGQRFSEIKSEYPGTRREFAQDTVAQKKFFRNRFFEGLPATQTTPLVKDANDLYKEYAPQIPGFDYSKEDIAVLSNFLGRQGTRKYLGNHIRDKKPLEQALPNIYGSKAKQRNKTPEQYLEQAREYYKEGGWLDKFDNGGVQPNYNDSNVSLPPGFKGWGYNTSGESYNGAWNGPVTRMGGSIPGATGMMYARTSGTSPEEPQKAQDGGRCWPGYKAVAGKTPFSKGSCQKAQDGYMVPPRKGVRKNPDGSESTHLMKAEQLEDGTWVGFPSLFQNADGKWIDMSGEKDWMNIYNEALKRGEVVEFGKDKDAAIKFGEGSWKTPKKAQDGGAMVSQYEEPAWYEKALDYAASPMTTLGYLARGEELPDRLPINVPGRSEYDSWNFDAINPAAYVKYGASALRNLDEGKYLDAAFDAVSAVPVVPAFLKKGKKATKAAKKAATKKGKDVETAPLKDLFIQPNIYPTSGPLPKNMEPYLSRKVYPFNKEQEIFESFLPTEAQLKNIESKSIRYDADGNIIPNMEYGGEIPEAQFGRLLKAAKNLYKGLQRIDNSTGNNIEYVYKNKKGEDVAKFSGVRKGDAIEVKGIQVSEPYRRQGVAQNIYEEVGKESPLMSRSSQQQFTSRDESGRAIAPANLLWEKLVQEGKAEKLKRGVDYLYKTKLQEGGVIEDDRGQWAYPGEITKINSNNITMKGVNYPVLGVSDTGDTKMMQPGKDYKFKGNSVTEFPMAQDGSEIIVSSTDDPRYRAYIDSLAAYNENKQTRQNWIDSDLKEYTETGNVPYFRGSYYRDEVLKKGDSLLYPEHWDFYGKNRVSAWENSYNNKGKNFPVNIGRTSLVRSNGKVATHHDAPLSVEYPIYAKPKQEVKYIPRPKETPLKTLVKPEGYKFYNLTAEPIQPLTEFAVKEVPYNLSMQRFLGAEEQDGFRYGTDGKGNLVKIQTREDYRSKNLRPNGKKYATGGPVELDQLTNFTNYNTPQPGGWLDKY